MTHFTEIRDAFALASMLERKEKLETDSAGALAQARALRTKLRYTPKGAARDRVEEDYDLKMREWAYYEAQLGNILRDARYIAYVAKQNEE